MGPSDAQFSSHTLERQGAAQQFFDQKLGLFTGEVKMQHTFSVVLVHKLLTDVQ